MYVPCSVCVRVHTVCACRVYVFVYFRAVCGMFAGVWLWLWRGCVHNLQSELRR